MSLNEPQTGFTLIELVLIMTLMGLLMWFLIPEFREINNKYDLESVTNEVVNGIKKAHSLAVAGVQGEGEFIQYYRFRLTDPVEESSNEFLGYQVNSLNEQKAVVRSGLLDYDVLCSLCITSNITSVDYRVPSGQRSSEPPQNMRVCHPSYGYYDIAVEQDGVVERGELQKLECSCTNIQC